MKLKTGDKVIVITGANKGKISTIKKVLRDENKVILDGVNIKKKHQKAAAGKEAGIVEIEAPIDASNVAFYDENSKSASKIKIDFDKKGKKVRIAKKSNKEIK